MSLLTELKAPVKSQNDRLVVKSAGKVFFVPYDDIDYIEAAGNYLKLHVGEMEHLIRETMTNVEGKLDAEKFVRIHRSAIVNISRIKELQSMFHGDFVVVLKTGIELPLSRGYRERVQQRLGIPI